MNNITKAAYRHLLYIAMLDIRIHCQSRGKSSINPFVWFQQYHASRIAGAIADWLHNLAHYSSLDFIGFTEQQFWLEYDYICRRFPAKYLQHYRQIFDKYLLGEIYIC